MLFCSLISCVIITIIFFEFLNDRYIKAYNSKVLSYILPVGYIFIIMFVNMFMISVLNLIANALLIGIISYFFYYENSTRKLMRVFEIEALFAIMIISGALGVFSIDALLKLFHIIPENAALLISIETAFSKIVLLFLYYAILSRIWKKNLFHTKAQYALYFIMFIYSIINLLAVAEMSYKESPIILTGLVGCIVFINTYLLYFVKFSDEKSYYKLQIEMMEQQGKIQYKNFAVQKEKYEEARSILYDVKKHIRMIEELYAEDMKNEAISYIKQINDILSPLIPFRYTDNEILNYLLADKKRTAEGLNVFFEVEVADVDINFMQPKNITTLFANLIDNAITASEKCQGEKYVGITIKEYNDMISIRVKNSVAEQIPIKNGKIVKYEGDQNGIGVLNIQRCVDDYEGNIIYKCSDDFVICDIILNRTNSFSAGFYK